MEYSCEEDTISEDLTNEYILKKILKRYKKAGPGLASRFDHMINIQNSSTKFCRTICITEIKRCYQELMILAKERQSKSPRVYFNKLKCDCADACECNLYLQLHKRPGIYLYNACNSSGIYLITPDICINYTKWLK